MKTIINEETNVRIFEAKLHEPKTDIRREEMSEFAGKIVKTTLVVLFLGVLVLTLILFFTGSPLITKVLLVIGGISFLAALAFLILKFTGFYTILQLSNPSNIQATDIATTLGVIGIFCYMVPVLTGAFYVPDFIKSLENFISIQKEGTEKIIEATRESLEVLRNLDTRIPPLTP